VKRLLPVAIAAEATLLILALGLGAWSGVPPFLRLSWSWSGALLGVLATAPLLILLRWSFRAEVAPIRDLVHLARERIAPLFMGCSTVQLALVSVAAAIGEEALFRGWLQPWLELRFPAAVAVAASSLLFGLAHPLSRVYAAFATAVGAYLGWLVLLSGNLLVPIATHALYDFIALILLVRLKPASASDVV
jgi:membrane protease YdiL (CAAX protease family)